MTDRDPNVWPRPDSTAGRIRAQMQAHPSRVNHNGHPIAAPAEPEDATTDLAPEVTEPEPAAPTGPKPDPSQGQHGTSVGITGRTPRDRIRAIAAGRGDALLHDPTIHNH